MALTTYTDLQAAALTWNWNRDTSSIPDFIRLAHDRINLGIRGPLLQTTADLTINAQRIAAPSTFQSVGRLWIDGTYDQPLRPATPDEIAYWNAVYDTGQPIYYAIEGTTAGEYFTFAPDPGATTYTGKLLYNARLAPLSSGSDTNLVLTRWPGLYLYGTMLEAAIYADDDARVAKFLPMFTQMLEMVNTQTRKDAQAGAALQPSSPYAV